MLAWSRPEPGSLKISRQVASQIVADRDISYLSSFLQEPEEALTGVLKDAARLEPGHCADARGSVDQNGDDRLITEALDAALVDRREECALLVDGDFGRLAFDELIALAANR